MKNRKISFKLIKTNIFGCKWFQVTYYGYKGELMLWIEDYEVNACWEDFSDGLCEVLMFQFDDYLDWIHEFRDEIFNVYHETRKQIVIEIPTHMK